MGFLRRIFGSGGSAESGSDEPYLEPRPQLTVWIRLGDASFENEREQQRTFELENRLIAAVDASEAGTYDTNNLERGFFGMRILTDDPDRAIAVIRPLLTDAANGSYLTVRRGAAGSSEERLEIDAEAK
jgi:hypothetical protein